jgi:hypothetical protein
MNGYIMIKWELKEGNFIYKKINIFFLFYNYFNLHLKNYFFPNYKTTLKYTQLLKVLFVFSNFSFFLEKKKCFFSFNLFIFF